MDDNVSNFTPRAQQTLSLARLEADRLNQNYIGTEHLLLGLLKLGQGVAVNVLKKMGLDLESVRAEVNKLAGTAPDQKVIGNVPYTVGVKKVLALAAKEAKALSHTYVGTEHILLGLLRESDGVAARVLQHFAVDSEHTRCEILKELDPNFAATESVHVAAAETIHVALPRAGGDTVDASKRYDVYCVERGQEIVVYRNVRLRGVKSLFPKEKHVFWEFVEIEQSDGSLVYLSKPSVLKFCEHGVTPKPEGGGKA